jgi:hypothetical protein
MHIRYVFDTTPCVYMRKHCAMHLCTVRAMHVHCACNACAQLRIALS